MIPSTHYTAWTDASERAYAAAIARRLCERLDPDDCVYVLPDVVEYGLSIELRAAIHLGDVDRVQAIGDRVARARGEAGSW